MKFRISPGVKIEVQAQPEVLATGPLFGFGPSAHSFLNHRRWWNPASLEEYLDRLRGGQKPAAGEEVLTLDQSGWNR